MVGGRFEDLGKRPTPKFPEPPPKVTSLVEAILSNIILGHLTGVWSWTGGFYEGH